MGKKPRIKLKLLQDKKERGGFGVPDWKLYYQAASATWLRAWIRLEDKRTLTIEGFDLEQGWHAYMWEGRNKNLSTFRRHILRKATLETWRDIKHKFFMKIPNWLSTLEALIYPNALDIDKRPTYKQILKRNGDLRTIHELKEQGIQIDWWSYAQIQSRYKKDRMDPGIYLNNLEIDEIWMGGEEKLIKKGYGILLDRKMEDENVKETMVGWAKNFGYNIELHKWEKAWNKNYRLTLATAYRENFMKMFYRWHIPPARLAKMFQSVKPNCWKCDWKDGTYYHMWWTCPQAKRYWARVRKWSMEITGGKIPLRPEIFLLGIFPENINEMTKYLGLHISTAARLLFAKGWKNTTAPSKEELKNKILECAEMDRLSKLIKDKGESDYYKCWQKYYEWLKDKRN